MRLAERHCEEQGIDDPWGCLETLERKANEVWRARNGDPAQG